MYMTNQQKPTLKQMEVKHWQAWCGKLAGVLAYSIYLDAINQNELLNDDLLCVFEQVMQDIPPSIEEKASEEDVREYFFKMLKKGYANGQQR